MYCQSNGLVINVKKTKAMKIRRGGRVLAGESLFLEGIKIEYVQSFTYLGVLFSWQGRRFTFHIEERVRKSLVASGRVTNRQNLSVRTAHALFNIYIAPIASYGIHVIWEHLTLSHLLALDKIKASFLKPVLGVLRNSKNRLVFNLVGCLGLVEDLVQRFHLSETPALLEFRRQNEVKMRSIPQSFYQTPAMTEDFWKGPLQGATRHLITRFAVHGFHHKLCGRRDFHEPSSLCRCTYCGNVCDLYHFNDCISSPSLFQLDL